MTGRRLVLLRHGQTSWNRAGRAQGHTDIELDDVGHAQASATASYLSALEPAALWSSDLTRARQTCAYLEKETGLTATYDDRLREFHMGGREGMTLPEFAEAFPEEYVGWLRGDGLVRVSGAEAAASVRDRILPALLECLEGLAPGQTGVVVTHGGSLKVGLVGLLGWPDEQAASLRGLDNCGWAVVDELEDGGRLRLEAYNQRVAHGGDGARDL